MRKFCKSFSAVFVLILLTSCVSPSMRYYPTEQPETIWATADDRACFYVSGDQEPIIGYIQSDFKKINVQYAMRPQVTRIMVYDIDGDIENCIEEWDVKLTTKNKLVVYVDKTTYFTKCETLAFIKSKRGT